MIDRKARTGDPRRTVRDDGVIIPTALDVHRPPSGKS
ncbi:unnamed protein product [Callosobruchus maculatus]|uniref:Uncharacterized protein n=1 Tax=Callosobruchus maculatus TaxID=64391 RepID=A0A653BGG6_CALMS|nr:unnamed protein product [Callosobruchus maculatus]